MEDLIRFSRLGEISAASDLHITNLIIAGNFTEKEMDALRENAKKFPAMQISLCKILAKPDAKELSRFRNKADYIAVDGRSLQLNKFACSTKGVDFLLQPLDSGKLYFDISLARMASQNNVKIAFLFSEFLNCSGTRQALLMKNAATVSRIARRGHAHQLMFSGANDNWEMRLPEDLGIFMGCLA